MSSGEALVVGGGVIGLFTAWELHKQGYAVTLLERGELGREASWAGGGILCPLYPWRESKAAWDLAKAGLERYPAVAEMLFDSTGIDPEYTVSGLRILRAEDARYGAVWAAAQGLEVEVAAESAAGLRLPGIAQIRNPRLCRALAAHLRGLGVALVEGQLVRALRQQSGRLEGVTTADGRNWDAALVVICAGAWSAAPALTAGLTLPIRPVRGQMLLLGAAPGTLREIRLGDSRYLIPRRDGRVLVGSTIEEAGFAKATTPAARELLLRAVRTLAPELEGAPVEAHWSGLRPGSPHGVPVVGRHPELEGLWFNAGHFRNGICMAPASAALLAALIGGRATDIDAQAYRPAALAINPTPAS